MRHLLSRQEVARAGTRQLRSQGPVSVHAYCIEGVTEPEERERANGVRVEIGVGAGTETGTGSGRGTGT